MRKRIGDFQLVDHGIEHPDYFQGCGVAFTPYSECCTGIGSNPAEALDDLIEQIACSGWECDELEARILADIGKRKAPKRPLARGDSYYHLSLRWNAAEPRQVAWTMADGNVMVGEVRDELCGTLYVTRVDGGSCAVNAQDTWPATPEDIEAACRFYANIGK